jgi:hypothetical protein
MFFTGEYAQNKAVSLGLPFLFLFTLLLSFNINDPSLWWVLVVTAHTLGYVHFTLGFFYQCNSLYKKQAYKKMVWLFILTASAVAFSVACIMAGYLSLLAIIAILYFITHGTLNELTLMQNQVGFAPKASMFLPLIFYVTPFFLLSLPHPSFFFTPQLEFLNPPPTVAITYLSAVVSIDILVLVSIALLSLFIILVPGRLFFQKLYKESLIIFSVTVLTFFAFLFTQPLNYVVLYFIVLSFHFISWSVYFGQVYKNKKPEKLPQYIRHHAYILVPLLVLSVGAFVHFKEAVEIHQVVFNGMIFITFAMVHNTTSLLNETWFLRIVKC